MAPPRYDARNRDTGPREARAPPTPHATLSWRLTASAASDSNRDSRLSVGRRRAVRRQLSVAWGVGGARASRGPVSLFRASYRGGAIPHWSPVEPMAPSTSHFTLSLNALSVLEISCPAAITWLPLLSFSGPL